MSPPRRERWYSIEGQRRNREAAMQSSHGPRRLISLVVLLVLTMIMIHQVSDPRRVARVAGAVGLLPGENRVAPLAQTNAAASGSSEIDSLWQPVDRESTHDSTVKPVENLEAGPTPDQLQSLFLYHGDRSVQIQAEVLEILLQSSPSDLLVGFCQSEFGASAPESATPATNEKLTAASDAVAADWFQTAQSKLARWIELSDSTSWEHQALVDLSRAFEHWRERRNISAGAVSTSGEGTPAMAPPTSESMARFESALKLALDRRLLHTFSDNTPWKSNERWPLTRTTQRAIALRDALHAGWMIPEMVPSTSIPQLVSLTDGLRGKGVRISGTIKLVDRAAEVGVPGIQEMPYGVVWIQPDDLSNQPIIVHIPDAIHTPFALLAEDTPVVVTGLLAKRRAYASARGGEVAPVIVAADVRSPTVPGTPTPTLSTLQHSIAKAIANPPTSSWQPPIDFEGPKRLLAEKLGVRLTTITALVLSSHTPDSSKVREYALSENTIAILLGMERFQEEIETLTQRGPVALNPTELSDDPPSHHQKLLRRIDGMVSSVVPISIENSPFPGLDWKQLYAVTLLSPPNAFDDGAVVRDASERVATIAIAKEVPSYWLQSNFSGQPCEAIGLVLVPDADSSPNNPRTMLCASLRWCEPESIAGDSHQMAGSSNPGGMVDQGDSGSQSLPMGWQMLLKRGWDLSWLDRLESLQGQSMTSKESNAFYSMIAASRARTTDLESKGFSYGDLDAQNPTPDGASAIKLEEPVAIMPLIRRAEGTKKLRGVPSAKSQSVGLRTQATVQVRRVQRIEVDDPQWRPVLGSNHYFQIDGLADIGRNKIEINYGEGTKPVVFQREFPITLVAASVPDWLLVESGDADPSSSQSWYPRMRTDVEGWFYRMWKYKTTQVSIATDDTQFQHGPMVIVDSIALGKPLETSTANPRATTSWTSIVTTLIGFAIIGWIAWKLQHDRLTKRQLEARAKSRKCVPRGGD